MTHTNSKILYVSGLLFGLAFLAAALSAQTLPDTTLAAALANLGNRAGIVFAGDVTAIRHTPGVVEIDFQVDRNIKSASAGTYTLREWTGLWAAGQRRYWIGERAVVFLNTPGKGGLSSSVDGMEGILPIVPGAANTLVVDVQRLRTRVLRPAGSPMVASATQMSLTEVAAAAIPTPALTPVTYPTEPIATPILRPIQAPTPMSFPNPVAVQTENSVILVMEPGQTDDFLFTDDAEPTHKNPEPLDAPR
jgi:hypothetical protein